MSYHDRTQAMFPRTLSFRMFMQTGLVGAALVLLQGCLAPVSPPEQHEAIEGEPGERFLAAGDALDLIAYPLMAPSDVARIEATVEAQRELHSARRELDRIWLLAQRGETDPEALAVAAQEVERRRVALARTRGKKPEGAIDP